MFNIYYVDNNGIQFKLENLPPEGIGSMVSYCLKMGFEITSIIDSEKD